MVPPRDEVSLQRSLLPLRGEPANAGVRRQQPAGSPASAGQPGTHLRHAPEGDGAVGCHHGKAWQSEGREALGDAAGERERLGPHHLEGVSYQASKQDYESVACCSGESNRENLAGARGGKEGRQEEVPGLLRSPKP